MESLAARNIKQVMGVVDAEEKIARILAEHADYGYWTEFVEPAKQALRRADETALDLMQKDRRVLVATAIQQLDAQLTRVEALVQGVADPVELDLARAECERITMAIGELANMTGHHAIRAQQTEGVSR